LKIFIEGVQPFFLNHLIASSTDFGLQTSKSMEVADVRILVDPHKNSIIDNNRDVIILAEPESVRPDLYSSRFLEKTKYILPLGKYRADRLNLNYFVSWPVELPTYKQVRKSKNRRIAIVNEHKFSSSARSEYGLRRSVIRYFESNYPNKLDVYGIEWNVSKSIELRRRLFAVRNNKSISSINLKESFSDLWKFYDSAQGHMHRDCELLQNYSASICIENDIDYVSEKVWKSLYAGCAVIYVGPDLKYDQKLKSCVITADNNLDSVVSKLKKLDENVEDDYAVRGLDFLRSDDFNTYSLETKTTEFYSNLKSLIGV
jgi:hypothetical protein